MLVVNVFSAVALWTYFAATRVRAHGRWWPSANANAAKSLAGAALAPSALAHVASKETSKELSKELPMVTLKEALKVDEQVLHAPEPHCPARPLVVVHVAAGAPRGLATLNVLLRGVTRADGVLVLVAEIAVFDTALREWCLLATACRLSVLSNSWQAEREDARHGVGRLGHTQDVAAPLHTVLQQALEVVPTMCAEGLALLRSGMSADVSFARRLEGVSKERVSCLFAGAPALCSEEALWVPRELLGEALRAPEELALALQGSGGGLRVLRASVELFVARAMQLGRYGGAVSVVAVPGS